MTPEQRCIAIAKACPDLFWIYQNPLESAVTLRPPAAQIFRVGQHPSNGDAPCDLLNDLNAMHEAEKVLTPAQHEMFCAVLLSLTSREDPCPTLDWITVRRMVSATAAQRAEAICKTLHLEESP
jgi:hypothetical protein